MAAEAQSSPEGLRRVGFLLSEAFDVLAGEAQRYTLTDQILDAVHDLYEADGEIVYGPEGPFARLMAAYAVYLERSS